MITLFLIALFVIAIKLLSLISKIWIKVFAFAAVILLMLVSIIAIIL